MPPEIPRYIIDTADTELQGSCLQTRSNRGAKLWHLQHHLAGIRVRLRSAIRHAQGMTLIGNGELYLRDIGEIHMASIQYVRLDVQTPPLGRATAPELRAKRILQVPKVQ